VKPRANLRENAQQFFKGQIRSWFESNKRDFPWRKTTEPYRLLIAEMMLRRTRAGQVGPVYEKFISSFRNPQELAEASPEVVATVLRPLGLTWRVPAFQLMARQLVSRYRGTVPLARDELLSLPGVGDYVADAVLCFAYGEPVSIVDTNTVRVAGRYFGFSFGPDSRRLKAVRHAVAQLLDRANPVESNLALLDFAATICKATKPICAECPVATRCVWQRSQARAATRQSSDRQLSP
jgi:A/G-specific adenine glycosylase